MLYELKRPQFISAVKFKSFGDLPSDLKLRKALEIYYIQQEQKCSGCGHKIKDHAITLDNQLICPNTYIIYKGNNITGLMSETNFEEIYKPICEEE